MTREYDEDELVTLTARMSGRSSYAIIVAVQHPKTKQWERLTVPNRHVHDNSEIFDDTPVNTLGKLVVPLWWLEEQEKDYLA